LGVPSPLEVRVGSQAHVFLEILSFSPASFAFVADAVYNFSQEVYKSGPPGRPEFCTISPNNFESSVTVTFMLAVGWNFEVALRFWGGFVQP
jgi:hypothetical protein